MDTAWSEPYSTLSTWTAETPEPEAAAPARPYVRETLHPNDPEFRARAIEWGRRERELEVAYNMGGDGAVVAFGFERQSNEAMRERFAALDRAEAERRRREDERICWCEDVTPDPWPGETMVGWCAEVSLSFWPEDDTWGWRDSGGEGWTGDERVCWCLDEGGGWQEIGEAWCDEEEDLARWEGEGGAWAWCAGDD